MSNHISLVAAHSAFFGIFYRLPLTYNDVGANSFLTVVALRKAAMRLSNLNEQVCNGVTGYDGFPRWNDDD